MAKVDDRFSPLPGTSVSYEVDTILVAAGLTPCDEFLRQARSYGILAIAAGDAEEIAEASSAMFGGKIAAFGLAKMLGKRQEVDPAWISVRMFLRHDQGTFFRSLSSLKRSGGRFLSAPRKSRVIPVRRCALYHQFPYALSGERSWICPISLAQPVSAAFPAWQFVLVWRSALSAGFQTAKRSLSCHGNFRRIFPTGR